MQQKLLLLILIMSTTCIISSCQKEIKNDDASTLKMAQTKPFNPQDIQTTALQSRAMSEKIFEQLNAKMQLVKQNIKNLLSERRERFGNSSVMEKEKPGKAVIHIPADYPTLQEAIDNATTNSKILVKGAGSDLGTVVVDKTGLTIQGEGNAPAINGNKLIISFKSGFPAKLSSLFFINGVKEYSCQSIMNALHQ